MYKWSPERRKPCLILFFLAAEPDANVVLPSPGFPANTALAESFGIEPRYYSIRAENCFQIDLDEVRNLVDRNTRVLLVNSPHNPTGAVLSGGEMTALHDFCAERGIQFVSDEVYHPTSITAQPSLPPAGCLTPPVIGDFFESSLPERPAHGLDRRSRSRSPRALSQCPQLLHDHQSEFSSEDAWPFWRSNTRDDCLHARSACGRREPRAARSALRRTCGKASLDQTSRRYDSVAMARRQKRCARVLPETGEAWRAYGAGRLLWTSCALPPWFRRERRPIPPSHRALRWFSRMIRWLHWDLCWSSGPEARN